MFDARIKIMWEEQFVDPSSSMFKLFFAQTLRKKYLVSNNPIVQRVIIRYNLCEKINIFVQW